MELDLQCVDFEYNEILLYSDATTSIKKLPPCINLQVVSKLNTSSINRVNWLVKEANGKNVWTSMKSPVGKVHKHL